MWCLRTERLQPERRTEKGPATASAAVLDGRSRIKEGGDGRLFATEGHFGISRRKRDLAREGGCEGGPEVVLGGDPLFG